MATQHCEYPKYQWIVHSDVVNFMSYKFHPSPSKKKCMILSGTLNLPFPFGVVIIHPQIMAAPRSGVNWTELCVVCLRYIFMASGPISSVQLLSRVWLFATPWIAATPGVHPNSCPSSRWCHPAISSSVVPFSSSLQTFSSSGSF